MRVGSLLQRHFSAYNSERSAFKKKREKKIKKQILEGNKKLYTGGKQLEIGTTCVSYKQQTMEKAKQKKLYVSLHYYVLLLLFFLSHIVLDRKKSVQHGSKTHGDAQEQSSTIQRHPKDAANRQHTTTTRLLTKCQEITIDIAYH